MKIEEKEIKQLFEKIKKYGVMLALTLTIPTLGMQPVWGATTSVENVSASSSDTSWLDPFLSESVDDSILLWLSTLYMKDTSTEVDKVNAGDQIPILTCDVSEASDGNVLAYFQGSVDTEKSNLILAWMNLARYEACIKGYPDPRDTSKNLSSSDYVPLSWDGALEDVARLRAAESCLLMYHDRPSVESEGADQKAFSTVNYTDYAGECLTWSTAKGLKGGIYAWYNEKQDYLATYTGGSPSGEKIGHYAMLIDPSYTQVGVAGFFQEVEDCSDNEGKEEFYATAAEFGKQASGDTTKNSFKGTCIQTLEISKQDTQVEFLGPSTLAVGESGQTTCRYSYYNDSRSYNVRRFLSPYTTSYWSSNPSVVSVDQEGKLVGLSNGMARIYVNAGGISSCISVTVGTGVSSVSQTSTSISTSTTAIATAIAKAKATKITKLKVKKVTQHSVKISFKKKTGYTYQVKVYKGKKRITTKNSKNTCIKIKKLKAASEYKIKVRTVKVINGKKVYGKWKTIKVTTKK